MRVSSCSQKIKQCNKINQLEVVPMEKYIYIEILFIGNLDIYI